jgi:hypothetical protein
MDLELLRLSGEKSCVPCKNPKREKSRKRPKPIQSPSINTKSHRHTHGGKNQMFIKIGAVDFTRSIQAQYTVQAFSETSIGIRGHVQSEADLKTTEEQLYLLREGKTEEIEIQTDDGKVWRGQYRINELSWRKERKNDNSYELSFNIGLEKR